RFVWFCEMCPAAPSSPRFPRPRRQPSAPAPGDTAARPHPAPCRTDESPLDLATSGRCWRPGRTAPHSRLDRRRHAHHTARPHHRSTKGAPSMRIWLALTATVLAALLIVELADRPPRPLGLDAPPTVFSEARARVVTE